MNAMRLHIIILIGNNNNNNNNIIMIITIIVTIILIKIMIIIIIIIMTIIRKMTIEISVPVLNHPSLSKDCDVISGKFKYVRNTPSP